MSKAEELASGWVDAKSNRAIVRAGNLMAIELRRLQAENDRMASELARPVSSEVSTLLAERDRLIAENAELKKDKEACARWLQEAADDISDWGAYASEYMQNKHGLARNVNDFKTRAAAMKGTP